MKTLIREKANRAADQGKYILRRPRLNGKSEKNHDDNVKKKHYQRNNWNQTEAQFIQSMSLNHLLWFELSIIY